MLVHAFHETFLAGGLFALAAIGLVTFGVRAARSAPAIAGRAVGGSSEVLDLTEGTASGRHVGGGDLEVELSNAG